MTRVFSILAGFSITFMAATLVLGMSLGNVSDPADQVTQRWATVHRLSGVAAALLVVLVNSIVVTYFIGTSRWCKEVVSIYPIDEVLAERSAKLKRRAFPFALLSMLVIVGVVALGGAADPAASLNVPPLGGVTWAQLHLLGSLIGLAMVGWSFLIERQYVETNGEIIDRIVEDVRRIRAERSLDS